MERREILYRTVSSILRASIDRHISKKMDAETLEKGPQAAFHLLFSGKNAPQTTWDGNENRTKQILADPSKGMLLVSNHPKFIEPLVFFSVLPPKKNTTLIARDGSEYFFGREIEKHFIPVYHKTFLETKNQKEKRQKRNLIQMDKAVQKLKEKNSILIAPDGGKDRGNNKWKKGSALLMEAALEMDEAYLVMGHVPQSKKFEQIQVFLRHDLKRPLRISEAINVQTIPIPESIKSLPHNDKRKLLAISEVMKNYYEDWANIKNDGTDISQKLTKAA